MEEKILEKIIAMAADIRKIPQASLNRHTSVDILGDGIVNYISIIAALENEYYINIPLAEFQGTRTFGEAASFIAKLMSC